MSATEDQDPHVAAAEEMVGKTVADRFRIEAVIGVGAMGVVYRAMHQGLRKDVAVKLLHRDLTANAEMVARFEREAAAASRLDHPNCVRVMDFGQIDDGRSFLVMEFLSGQELAGRVGKPMPPEEVVKISRQVLSALEHAHGHGIVHRDVKPENIFLVPSPTGEQVKILDFGIAKVQQTGEKALTRAGMVFGTPHYMSPEQAKGTSVDARSDLYSVGVVMYEMLSGDVPFGGEDPAPVLRGHIKDEPPALPSSVPPGLRRFVFGLLAKQPDERFADAEAALAALDRAALTTGPRPAAKLPPPPPIGSSLPPPTTPRGMTPDEARLRAAATPPPPPPSTAASPPPPPPPPASAPPAAPAAGAAKPGPLDAVRNMPRAYKNAAMIGGGLTFAVLIFAATSRGGDDDAAGDEAADTSAAEAAGDEAEEVAAGDEGGGEDVKILDSVVDENSDAAGGDKGVRALAANMATIEAFMAEKKYDAARTTIEPLLEIYPDNATLHWRMGQVLANISKQKNATPALEYYRDAVQLDADLLDDEAFTAGLWPLLDDPRHRAFAASVAVDLLGETAHDRLVSWLNVQKGPMPYAARHRVMDHLEDAGKADAINHPLQVAHDLWQARSTDDPCEVFKEGLAAAREDPDSYLWGSVANAPIPTTEGEEAAECPGLAESRTELAAEYGERYAGLSPSIPAAYRAKPSGGGGNRRTNNNRRRRR